MSRRRRTATVTFRGPPHRLSSLIALPEETDALEGMEARLEGAEVRGVTLRPAGRERLDIGKLTLRLPRSTPPGTYAGSVEIAGQKRDVVAEVEARPQLEADLPRISVEAAAGAELTAEFRLVNTGNVPCGIPAASSFCLFDGHGIDHAFWAALGFDPPKGKQRVDVLLDDLADSHGGLVEVRARAGERTIAPGESTDVQLSLRFSDRMRPGHRYAGAWEAEGLRLPVRVTVPARTRRRSPEAAR